MPFYLVNGDLVSMNVDAIVNAANVSLKMVEGVGRAIFHNAGDLEMTNACKAIGRCEVGQVVETPSFKILNTKSIIHAVAPIYINGKHNEYNLLEDAYNNCLNLAISKNYTSIAFPLLGGEFNWPLSDCYQVAKRTILNFLKNHDLDVYMVFYKNIPNTIDDQLHEKLFHYITSGFKIEESNKKEENIRFIDEVNLLFKNSNLTTKELAYLANCNEKTFKRILEDDTYIPSKNLALSLGIAFKLNSVELSEFLNYAGYSLNRADVFDLLILFFIDNNIFDVYKINDALFKYNYRPSLGEK